MPCTHDQSVSTHGKCNVCGAQLHPSKTMTKRAVSRGEKAALAEMQEVLNHERTDPCV
jgi:hypothetical protein